MIVTSWILVYLRGFHSGDNCEEVSEDDGESNVEDSGLCNACFLVRRLIGFWRTSDETIIVNTFRARDLSGYMI